MAIALCLTTDYHDCFPTVPNAFLCHMKVTWGLR